MSILHGNFHTVHLSARTARRLGYFFAAVLILACTSRPIAAHAVLIESTPAPQSVSPGSSVAIRLRFNVRIDADRSIITVVRRDGSNWKLQTLRRSEPNTLEATAAGLPAGDYRIRWQVLAPDGHITSGEIPFSVGGANIK